jgi:diguanylate cyclase (GGDEF)-like protein
MIPPAFYIAAFVVALIVAAIAYALGCRDRDGRIAALEVRLHTDPLTALPNRLALEVHLRDREHSGEPYMLALLDLDGFSVINNRYGHAAGDDVLREIGRRLGALDGVFAARLGGDELVAVWDGAALVAETLAVAVGMPMRVTGSSVPVRVSASIGVAASDGREPASAALARADAAMYQAKAAGAGPVLAPLPPALTRRSNRDRRTVRLVRTGAA